MEKALPPDWGVAGRPLVGDSTGAEGITDPPPPISAIREIRGWSSGWTRLSRQHQLALALTGQPQVLRDLQHGRGVLGDLLRDRAAMLILDDVWSADPRHALQPKQSSSTAEKAENAERNRHLRG
jgi:hypothetical protein